MRQIDDAFLQEYVPEAEKAALDGLPPEDAHTFSRRFQRKMQALLRYERRRPFARRAAAAGRAVAAVLLCVLILNAVLIGSVEAYRERAYEIVETVTRKFTAFSVKVNENTPPAEFKPIEPPYVPEGYEVVERQDIGDIGQRVHYCNDAGAVFTYEQSILIEGTVVVDTEDALVQVEEIFGCEVKFITEGEMTQIYWICGGHSFSLVGNAPLEELQMVAEKILENFEK